MELSRQMRSQMEFGNGEGKGPYFFKVLMISFKFSILTGFER
jgi:hypothetical protein